MSRAWLCYHGTRPRAGARVRYMQCEMIDKGSIRYGGRDWAAGAVVEE